MNTPNPYDKCKHLYYDAIMPDGDYIEYIKELEIGNEKCPGFESWKINNVSEEGEKK